MPQAKKTQTSRRKSSKPKVSRRTQQITDALNEWVAQEYRGGPTTLMQIQALVSERFGVQPAVAWAPENPGHVLVMYGDPQETIDIQVTGEQQK